jgi:uncharacterized repeat protein (TIGR03837 family)
MQWDLYCRVVDNFGDVGVAWRLAADLAGRGESVRLAIDDASALAWMAPRGAPGVEVVGWNDGPSRRPDVVVEMFGGGLPEAALADRAAITAHAPVFINLEHLSAESYVERSHRLPSPRTAADGRPLTTWFFYPGFTEGTGGLLREPGLAERWREFGDGSAWLASLGIQAAPGERRVSLFCYASDSAEELLDALAGEPTLLLLTPGFATDQATAILGPSMARGAMRAVALPYLEQADFDRLLAACDINFVRGEDSLVRAIWAGAPFVWQLYPQDDGVHAAKLEAFLDRFLAGASPELSASVRALFQRWNGLPGEPVAPTLLGAPTRSAWARHCERWRSSLAKRYDLTTQLIGFASAKR